MVNAIERCGGLFSRSKTAASPSPAASEAKASDMRVQIDMGANLDGFGGGENGPAAEGHGRPRHVAPRTSR